MKQDEQVMLPARLIEVLSKLTGELVDVQRMLAQADQADALGQTRRELEAISEGIRGQLGKLAQGMREALLAGFDGAGVGVEGAETTRDPAVLVLLEELLGSVTEDSGLSIRVRERGDGQVEVDLEYPEKGLTDDDQHDGRE
jgi:hypothetical protein